MKAVQSLHWLVLAVVSLVPRAALGQAAANSESNDPLERVLEQMDTAAKNFHATEANVIWDQYQKVVDEHEEQDRAEY